MQHLEELYTRKTLRNQEKLRRNHAGARLKKQGMVFVSLLFVLVCLQNEHLSGRVLSGANLGGAGKCSQFIATGVQSLNDVDVAPSKLSASTFLASYPGSGKRLTWKIMEALTGNIMHEDDLALSENQWDSVVTMKESWPHPEGTWSFDAHMDQVFLLVRNPRFAIPSYHTIKYEINADKESKSNDEKESWESWRDAHLNEELDRWGEYIEFWMQGGPKSNSTTTEGEGPQDDWHCFHEDCTPKAVIQFEKLMSPNPITGQTEMSKIGSILATSPNLDSIDQDVRPCIYNQVMSRRQLHRDNSDGPTSNNIRKSFTTAQLGTIKTKIETLKEKYSAHAWSQQPVAIDLTNALDYYVGEVEAEYQLSKQQDVMEED